MKNIFLQIPEKLRHETTLALATVVAARGSTPQKPGSSALIGAAGLLAGTVGGGIVEGNIQKLASEAIKSGKSGLYNFNLANDISKKEEAICGGEISVLLDAGMGSSRTVFDELLRSMKDGVPGVLVTSVSLSEKVRIEIGRYWMKANSVASLPETIIQRAGEEALRLISEKKPYGFSALEPHAGEDPSTHIFLQAFFPPDRLIIAGAGHIGRALAHLGSLLDFEVTIIDDRPDFASKDNVPDADIIIAGDIGETMDRVANGDNSYVVIVTRGHKDDALALKPCIRRRLPYIGMIGSRNKVASMRRDFLENGFATPEEWDKVHAPIGLEIESQTVEEIAISIAAELVLVRNARGV